MGKMFVKEKHTSNLQNLVLLQRFKLPTDMKDYLVVPKICFHEEQTPLMAVLKVVYVNSEC